jgi:acetyl-CoA acetyltransferase family protein
MAMNHQQENRVAIIEGVRTPFLRSGTEFNDLMIYELGRYAVSGLLNKVGLDASVVDQLIYGTVVSDPATSNVAREVSLASGLPNKVPSYTVSEVCVSANQAICNAADLIWRGYADVVIAGGTETASDVPVRFTKKMRQKFIRSGEAKGLKDYYRLFKDVRFADLAPVTPGIEDFFTRMSMGQSCDRLTRRLGITREEQDAYAVRSHQLAAQATKKGLLREEIVMVAPPPAFKPITQDNGIRPDTSVEKLARLKPAFDKNYGTVTAGNSSFLTDGASAVLLMSEKKAAQLGYRPKGFLLSYAFVGTDPAEEMLLGQTYATVPALSRAEIKFGDLGVLEIHEAFAGQMLATIKLLGSKEFAREKLGLDDKVGDVDYGRLNRLGGSLSLGHPFGATGGRLVTTCINRLIREDKKYGLVAACALSGLGNAIVIEKA